MEKHRYGPRTERQEIPKDLGSFVNSLKRASTIVRMLDPDHIFVPVAGSVPFVDLLRIVDRKIPLDNIRYLPNSSRFYNRNELMSRWYERFYEEMGEIGEKRKIACLDEVLSGSSAVAGYNQFLRSLERLARVNSREDDEMYKKKLHKLIKKVEYYIVGFREKGHAQNPSFRRLENKGIVHVIDFEEIPTIDNVAMNPIRFKQIGVNKQGRPIYSPEIERFDITPCYLNLLKSVAGYCGVDPSTVCVSNLGKIQEEMEKSFL